MTDNAELQRRDLLKLTGAGVAGLAGVSGVAAAEEPAGSGTASDPYVIESASELGAMASNPSDNFVLGSNIDASDVGGDAGFSPISDFAGSLDGQGYEISGLTIDRPDTGNVGLFANTTDSATIKNVGLVDVDIVGDERTGGLVGRNTGTIERAYTDGTVESDSYAIGGLVGQNDGTISESFSTTNVTITEGSDAGGFVGRNYGTIVDAYATGEVSGTNSSTVGGFAGDNSETIETAFSTGLLGAVDYGGFTADSDNETDCYWDATASGIPTTNGSATALSTDQMQGSNSVANSFAGFSTDVWSGVDSEYPVLSGIDSQAQLAVRPDTREAPSLRLSQMDGDGSASAPYQITEAAQLRGMADDPIAFFEITQQLDADGVGSDSGFEPINGFLGDLDGQGYEISGLTIDRPDTGNVGLFGALEGSASVRNVGLVDVDIVGDERTGSIVGRNDATIERVYASGSVESDSYAIGGLVGQNDGTISESFSTANVTVTEGSDAGGFVGRNYGTIVDAYATGEVSGTNSTTVGGFAGDNSEIIETSFSTGLLGAVDYGGFTADSDNETDCYWDATASGIPTTNGNATALSTDQMTTGDNASFNFGGYDFESTWSAVDGAYPVLSGIDTQSQLDIRSDTRAPPSLRLREMDGDGSASTPYQITEAAQLRATTDDPIAFFEIATGLDASNVGGSQGFEPINGFLGDLDGQGNEISGLTIDRPDTGNVGLFGTLEGSAIVRNVGLVDVDIVGDERTGSIVGRNATTIERVYASGSVESDSYAIGGLVGQNDGTISKAATTVDITVTESSDVGGFVGRNYGTVVDAYARGDVSGPNSNSLGGFAGDNSEIIERSYATGQVTGNNIGGFTAESDSETNCYWDIQASGVSSTAGNANGLETSKMQGEDALYSLSGFDFENTWTTIGGDYPEFQYRQQTFPVVDGAQTTDPDGDGLAEDLNGNGRVDFDDVNTLFDNRNSDAVTNNVEAFDFKDDGSIDYADIIELFNELP